MSGALPLPRVLPRSSMTLLRYCNCAFYIYLHNSSPTGYIPLIESLNTLLSTDENLRLHIKALIKHLDRTLAAFEYSGLRLLGKTYRRDINATTFEKRKPDLFNQTFLSCTDFIALLRAKVPSCPQEFYDSILGLDSQSDFLKGSIQCHLTKMEWLK